MEYDIKLQHKAGKQMIIADMLSQQSDHSLGTKEDNDYITALLEDLWICLLDMELQDTVAIAQKDDAYAREVLASLNDQLQSPVKWTTEVDPNGSTHLFYDGRMYIPDNLSL